jgi:hypothetical protein
MLNTIGFLLLRWQLFFFKNVRVSPNFPAWLKTQNELNALGLKNACISDTIPHGLWKSFPNVTSWSLSGNKLRGQVPFLQFHPSAYNFDLSSNKLDGPLPLPLPLFPSNFWTYSRKHWGATAQVIFVGPVFKFNYW